MPNKRVYSISIFRFFPTPLHFFQPILFVNFPPYSFIGHFFSPYSFIWPYILFYEIYLKYPPYSFIWPYSFNWHLRVTSKNDKSKFEHLKKEEKNISSDLTTIFYYFTLKTVKMSMVNFLLFTFKNDWDFYTNAEISDTLGKSK